MPLISRVKKENLYQNTGNTGNTFGNPNSMLRNTVRPRVGEFVVMSFLSDLDDGDKSLYHSLPMVSANGKSYSEYKYCMRGNISEDGRQSGTCAPCLSPDRKISNSRFRFSYWAFLYYHYHLAQNPYLEREGELAWDFVTMGKKEYYREPVMKPQLFVISHTGWKVMENKAEMLGTLDGFVFDYAMIRNETSVNYQLERSLVDVPDMSDDIISAGASLPLLEEVASGAVVEYEFPTIGSGSVATSDRDAFDAVAGQVEI